MHTGDTIAAISSAVGRAARMIVRASGPEAHRIARELADGLPEAGCAILTTLTFDDLSFPAWVYRFDAPRSATGEDVIELHIPGNPLLSRMLLDELIRRGARQAEPGEFTARAYFNGRLDLAEAEGVAATIAASSQRQLRAARQLLGGELARRLRPIMDQLAEVLALVEVGIDFSDEDVTFIDRDALLERLQSLDESLDALLCESIRFEPLTHEPTIVLVGRPNAGKSTLLNALAGQERAIVSPQAGTTRDVLWAPVSLPRGLVRVFDVAGIDDGPTTPLPDDIDRKMRDAALRAVEQADVVVLVRDVLDDRPPINPGRGVDLVVFTQVDKQGQSCAASFPANCLAPSIFLSAVTGQGMTELRKHLDELAFGGAGAGGSQLALNARHVAAIENARRSLNAAHDHVDEGAEIIALYLREALDALGSILGAVTPDDVLGRIFSRFCIGK